MATVYLSPTGSDSNTYAQAQNPATPWLTPAKVNTSATSGDTVQMAAGTYAMANITFTKNFTFIGAASGGKPTTILDYSNTQYTYTLNSSNGQLTFQNIWFKDFDNTTVSNFTFYTLIVATYSFINCYFTGTAQGAFNSSFVNSTNAGIGCGINLTNCCFDDVKSHSQASGYSGLFVGNKAMTITSTNCTFSFRTTTASLRAYCIWYGNVVTHTLTVKNMIVKCESGADVKWTDGYGGGGASTTASYSCFYNLTSGTPTGTGVITSDPLLVDPANSNFNLRPTSPCIDTGTVV